jgi:hypothetical protein
MLRNMKFDAAGNSLWDQVFERSGLLSFMVASSLLRTSATEVQYVSFVYCLSVSRG